jgi:hypothetical protein
MVSNSDPNMSEEAALLVLAEGVLEGVVGVLFEPPCGAVEGTGLV